MPKKIRRDYTLDEIKEEEYFDWLDKNREKVIDRVNKIRDNETEEEYIELFKKVAKNMYDMYWNIKG